MTFGLERGCGSSVEDSERIIDRYLDRNGNFIDTANSYNLGHSEKNIELMKSRINERAFTVLDLLQEIASGYDSSVVRRPTRSIW